MKNNCVYTCLLGGYEHLNEQPVAKDSQTSFICFTDNKHLSSETWTLVPVKPTFSMDPMRSQRVIKAKPWDFLSEYESSIYIDNSVVLKEPPEKIIEFYGFKGGLALAEHSFRDTVMDEFVEVSRLGLDDQSRIFEQLNHYMIDDPELLSAKPFWGGLLIRAHHDPRVKKMGELWLEHILRYSRRDQLSLNLAIKTAGLDPLRLDLDNRVSWLHDWPVMPGRDYKSGQKNAAYVLNMPLGRIKSRVRDLDERLEILDRENQELLKKADGAVVTRNIVIICCVILQLITFMIVYLRSL